MAVAPTILGPIFVDDHVSASAPIALLWLSLFTEAISFLGRYS